MLPNPQYIHHQGQTLAYYRMGQGRQPILLLHGFCEDSRMWPQWLAPLLPLADWILVDLPGFGHSSCPPLDQYQLDNLAQSVSAVAQALQLPPSLAVLGHSMGGYVALAMAAQGQVAFRGLGLFHSHPYADSPEKQANRLKSADFIRRHGAAPFVGQLIPALFGSAFAKTHPQFMEEFIAQNSEHLSDALVAASLAMRDRPDQSAVLQAFTGLSLLIVGEQDKAIATEHSMAQLALARRSHVHIFPNVGHMGMFEAPAATQEAVAQWLEELAWDEVPA